MLLCLNALSLADKKTLLVLPEVNKNVVLSGRNIQNAKITTADQINTYDVMNADNVIFVESSINKVENLLNKASMSILKRPLVTEKVSALNEKGKYGFIVDADANKVEIKKAVEKQYGVNVEKVNTMNVMGKTKDPLHENRYPFRSQAQLQERPS